MAHNPLFGESERADIGGVTGVANLNNGVNGYTKCDGCAGVAGWSNEGRGFGLYGRSVNSHGLVAISLSTNPAPGHGVGVWGESHGYNGVRGVSHARGHGAVAGIHVAGGIGVYGTGQTGLFGETTDPTGAGVLGRGPLAGAFQGKVRVEGEMEVTGDIRLLNADCAEEFDIAEAEVVEPGTVMVLGEEGALHPSHQAYDKRVAGIVSGAGDYQPALVLDRQSTGRNRQPIALMGKVFCKVDTSFGPVEIGDLLTTSPTPGHAMKADDPTKAFGSVIGKALRSLSGGQGLIPVLVALQ